MTTTMTSNQLRRRVLALTSLGALAAMLAVSGASANERALQPLLEKIDTELYEQSEADVRAWLDAMLDRYGEFGVYPDHLGRQVRFSDDQAQVNFGAGHVLPRLRDAFSKRCQKRCQDSFPVASSRLEWLNAQTKAS